MYYIPNADDNCIRLCWWTTQATTRTSPPPSHSTSRADCPQRCSSDLKILHRHCTIYDFAQNNFKRLSPPSPPGGVGANAKPAWTDPSSVSWSSSGDRLFHCFSRLALRSHQGLARTYGPEDEGGPHCCPDTQVLHLENDHDDVDVVTVVGQDRHD